MDKIRKTDKEIHKDFNCYKNRKEIELFMYLENEFNKKGIYYMDVHNIHFNMEGLTPENIIIIIHEAVHATIGEMLIGFLISDFYQLLGILLNVMDNARTKLLEQYLERIDDINYNQKLLYSFNHPHECDIVLSQSLEFMTIVTLCLRIYKIYTKLNKNLQDVTEGLATYFSLNYSLNSNDEVAKLLDREQKKQKNLLKSRQGDNYTIGYFIAQKIEKKYGWIGLFTSVIAATNIPYYNIDLIGCRDSELDIYIDSIYNCNKRWLSFLTLDESYINNILQNPENQINDLTQKIVNSKTPVHSHVFRNSIDYFLYYSLNHPKINSVLSSYNIEFNKDTKKNEMNINEINTLVNFFAHLETITISSINYIKSQDTAHDIVSKEKIIENLKNKHSIERKINTLKYIKAYNDLLKDNSYLPKLINNTDTLNKENIEYIRGFLLDI